jgi:polyhydroxybutyrate depolymerase
MSGGLERTFRVHTPAHHQGPLPLVLVFHGRGQSVSALVQSTGFDAVSDRGRFLAVYPESVGGAWSVGVCCSPAFARGIDDVRFVDDLVADLGTRFRIDPRRVYATGVSNGGIFAYRLACRRAATIAAVGAVAATMEPPCDPSRPVSVVHVHGLADRFVPFGGGEGIPADHRRPSVPATIAYWRHEDGCRTSTERRSGAVTTVTWHGCGGGTAVSLTTIAGGGHAWPRSPFDATSTIWRFFRSHPRQGE